MSKNLTSCFFKAALVRRSLLAIAEGVGQKSSSFSNFSLRPNGRQHKRQANLPCFTVSTQTGVSKCVAALRGTSWKALKLCSFWISSCFACALRVKPLLI